MADLGRLLKPSALARIVLLYLVVMGLYTWQTRAQDEGIDHWVLVTLGLTAMLVLATVTVVFILIVVSRGGLASWRAGRVQAAGQTGDALERYNRVLARNPNLAEALVARAEILHAGGNLPAAVADLDRAIAVTPHVSNFPDPVLYRAYLERGRLREGRGDPLGALADWAQAGRVQPGAPDPYVLRGRAALESGDWAQGRNELAKGIRLLSHSLDSTQDTTQRAALLNMRGLAYNLLGEHRRALADLEQSLQLQPDAWVTHYNLGATYVNLGHPEQARAELQQAIALNPSVESVARNSRSYAPLWEGADS
jgi:tetratricopeptide (TPR) repeat protein